MEKIRVYNRSNSTVFYKDEDTNRTRTWEPSTIGKESYKDLDFEEIERVVNTRGGKILFEEYLLIKDKKVCEELDLTCPKEYFYDVDEVKRILESGTDFEVVDMIENGPEGIKDIIKQVAIEMKLDSSRKRKIIKDRLGFDVNFAIENEIEFKTPIVDKKVEKRETTPKYVVKKEE